MAGVVAVVRVAAIGLLLAVVVYPNETVAFRSASPTTAYAATLSTTGSGIRTRSSRSTSRLRLVPMIGTEEIAAATVATPLLLVEIAAAAATTTSIATSSSVAALSEASVVASGAATSGSNLLTNSDFLVFVAGVFPFAWATVEFWRRIMFGESFGTGTDSVIIGMEDSPADSRGQKVLGKGALVTAYVLFVCAFGTLAVVGYSIATSAPPSPEDLAAVSREIAAGPGGGLPLV